MSYLVKYINTIREVFKQSAIQIDAIVILLYLQEEISIVEVIHPVLFNSFEDFPAVRLVNQRSQL